ncbi:MAG: hypothetical protein J0I12_30720 [Candidatus Eremiobacteraeota bacterium]|nr:hypothetical protein [Candidatus Eremiobacteraeota bacterium]
MKLLLQRSLGDPIDGPFWIESAHLDERLHAFLILMRDRDSHFEPRYGPGGEVYWISDKDGLPKVYRQNSKEALTQRSTFKFGFEGERLATLECADAESPYLLNGEVALDSSLTHLDRIPDRQDWLISTLEMLYQGPLETPLAVGPTPARRFSAGPRHFYYTHRHELIEHAYGGQPERIFACQEGSLVYPLYTPGGILVTQEDCAEHHLWLVNPQTKEASSLWNGPDEWVYACAFTGKT